MGKLDSSLNFGVEAPSAAGGNGTGFGSVNDEAPPCTETMDKVSKLFSFGLFCIPTNLTVGYIVCG